MIFLCFASLMINFILYFFFGLLMTGSWKTKGPDAATLPGVPFTILAGFFLYYSLFTFACVPIMYRWRPLSMLTMVWGIVAGCLVVLSLVLNGRYLIPMCKKMTSRVKEHLGLCIVIALLLLIQLYLVLRAYQFTLDAAYYVANVTTSVHTNSLNIYDPYTGDWQDHFEMRYFFATYPMNDAVMCSLLNIHPLMQVKTVMASVVVILTNLGYYLIGREIFGEKDRQVGWMMAFCAVANFCFITIYTSSNFLTTRTYEGKSILGNVVLTMLLYLYIRILDQGDSRKVKLPEERRAAKRRELALWAYLFLVCFGSTVLSSSSNMLVPAALAILFFPLALMQKNWKVIPRMILCMLPNLILMLVYVAYVKGKFVFYTYPR